jgi:hypothetical protein
VANALYDRAGFVLLGDVFRHSSFGPWKRALAKVDKEENFHLVPSLVAALEAHGVIGTRIGTAGGSALAIRVGADDVAIGLDELAAAWRTAF